MQSIADNVVDDKKENDADENKSKKFRQSVSDKHSRRKAYDNSIRIGEAVLEKMEQRTGLCSASVVGTAASHKWWSGPRAGAGPHKRTI